MPAVVGDIFGLGDVYIRQVSPVTVGIDTSGNFITESGWSNLRSYGWFGGGLTPGITVSSVDRIDFSNDTGTTTPRGPLSSARRALAATGNSNYGWFGGGWFAPSSPQINYSTVDRIDFSNDSVTASPRSILSATRYKLAATGNSNYGWFGGGALFDPVTPANTPRTTVDRIDFSNDSATASPRGPLSLARYSLAATGNSNYGWFGGGSTPSLFYSTVDRIDFSNDSPIASVRGPLSSSRNNIAATGNSNYGWFGGGNNQPSSLSTVDRIDFSNDLSTAFVGGSLSATKSNHGATGNSNYGWFGGGGPSTVDRINFSNDLSRASPRGPLSLGRSDISATSGQAKGLAIRLQKAGNYGWFGGGINQVPIPVVYVSRVDRIDFSNDSVTASIRGVLSSPLSDSAATGNSNYGWFGGGLTPTFVSRVERIDFSNDSSTASVRGPLSLVRWSLSATGNSNYGWFGGGFAPSIPGRTSRVDRIDFSNDSSTASPRGSLSVARNYLAATGNSSYGWFGGGYNPALGAFPNNVVSRVDRIDFSNDSATASVRGPLAAIRYGSAATGNSNYGWFAGYFNLSRIDRIDFSNDSATASPRGVLSLTRRYLSATGNSNYGWFAGGNFPGSYSTVDRIDFSNDSVIASPRGLVTTPKAYMGATSNTPI